MPPPFAENRKIAEHAPDAGIGPTGTGVGAEPQIFLDGEPGESAAALWHVGDAERRDRFGRTPLQPLPGKPDFTLAADHAADGTQRRRLAGTIGAEQHGHAAFLDRDIDAVHDLGLTVERLDRTQLEDRRHQCRLPRYASVTAALSRTSSGEPSAMTRPKLSTTT